jgi:hypothetical protein
VIRHDVPPFTVVVKYEYRIDVKLLFQKDAMATPRVAVNIWMATTDDASITDPTGSGVAEL